MSTLTEMFKCLLVASVNIKQYLDWKGVILELDFRGRCIELERKDMQIIKRKRTTRLT